MKANLTFCLVVAQLGVMGQTASTPPAVVWDMRIENRVVYWSDSPDVSKLATNPSSTTPVVANRTFATFVSIADIVSINGRPAKGTWTIRATQLNLSPNPAPGQAIADTTRQNQVGGYPGTTDAYQINFRVPDGTAPGLATIRLTAAFIPGPSIQVPVK